MTEFPWVTVVRFSFLSLGLGVSVHNSNCIDLCPVSVHSVFVGVGLVRKNPDTGTSVTHNHRDRRPLVNENVYFIYNYSNM